MQHRRLMRHSLFCGHASGRAWRRPWRTRFRAILQILGSNDRTFLRLTCGQSPSQAHLNSSVTHVVEVVTALRKSRLRFVS